LLIVITASSSRHGIGRGESAGITLLCCTGATRSKIPTGSIDKCPHRNCIIHPNQSGTLAAGAEMRLPENVFALGIVLLALAVGRPDIGIGPTDRSPAATVTSHLAQGKTMIQLAQASALADLPAASQRVRDASAISGSANPNDRLRLGIETEKSVQTPKSLRRVNDCADDDECDDYTGLPRSHPAHSTLKNLRTPFIGLSVTSPLQ